MQFVKYFRFSSLARLEAELNHIEAIEIKESIYTFQREWNEHTLNGKSEPSRVFNDKLNPSQDKKVRLLAKYISNLGFLEQRYFIEAIREKCVRKPDFEFLNMGLKPEKLAQINDEFWPAVNPRWTQQQEILAKLWPLGQHGISKVFTEIAGFGSSQEAQVEKVAVIEEKVEVKQEKLNFDVELTAIDPAQKIKIIKEVRAIFNLGLKEAKDLVEKAPANLSKGLKKDDAQALKEKLESFGCTITLV